MSKLQQVREAVQQAADAIASVLGMEVTIADEELSRIAGTGCYAERIGDTLVRASAFDQILRDGQGLIIDNPGKHWACHDCGAKDQCREQAEMCCPIQMGGATIGIIALVAFTPQQKRLLLKRQRDLFAFLGRMADLLASKVAEQERLSELITVKNQLETVINAVHEGIVAVDSQGEIVRLNAAARKMLGIAAETGQAVSLSALFPELALDECLQNGREIVDQEISGWVHQQLVHCVTTLTPWSGPGGIRGAVATLQGMEAVKRIASRYGPGSEDAFAGILGDSEALGRAKQVAAVAARNHISVMIRGESGSGKELFARTIHDLSPRRGRPFVALNCAAIPETLLESELFGYEEGAFTGARRGGKPGKFELAHGGTLFLDEIGDMSLQLQAKLLRVLQEKTVERLGGTSSLAVDVRIISATHKDIERMVAAGEFRQDLYYRIHVFPLFIPPLRQRREDLPALIRHFFAKYREELGKEVNGIDDEAYRLLITYDWPGNVRELENVMEYLVSIENGDRICAANVSARIRTGTPDADGIIPVAEMERRLIMAALARYGTSTEGKEQAAQALGISTATLYRKLREYGKERANEAPGKAIKTVEDEKFAK